VADRYRVTRLLERGGEAEVFEAFVVGAAGFERKVAVKRLRADVFPDESFFDHFVAEARIAAQLHHASIVGVFDFGVMDDLPFIAMELVEGLSLRDLRAAAKKIPVEIALAVGVEVAYALDYAHRAKGATGEALRIVHRDVSPENVLVGYAGDVKLSDFGIALAAQRVRDTQVGVAKGKLSFMAPEQMRGDDVDHSADIFALGCLLHWMIIGKSPLEREGALETVRRGGDASLSGQIDREVASLIERATRTDRKKRFRTAGELARECGAILSRRTSEDLRTILRSFVEEFEPERTALRAPPIAEMMDVELVLGEAAEDGLRRFESIVVETRTALTGEISEPTPVDTTDTVHSINISATIPEIEKTDRLLGTILHGYRLEQVLGTGSLAKVYRARHQVLDRQYAVKILHGNASESLRSQERLRREAVALGRLQHPNIVSITDFGATDDGRPFLTMELLEGVTLKDVLKQGKVEPNRAGQLARQIAEALSAAHAAGVVHRDLKPANVMIVNDRGREVVKILDFGIARLIQPEGTKLTASDMLLGTPRYMAPEQIEGASNVGPPADLYSLGVVLYAMLSGGPPFVGTTLEVVRRQREERPKPLDTGTPLDTIVLALLEKAPENRPRSAADVVDLLEDAGYTADTDTQMIVPPTSVIITPSPPPVRAPVALLAALFGLLAAVVVLGGALYVKTRSPVDVEPPKTTSAREAPQVVSRPGDPPVDLPPPPPFEPAPPPSAPPPVKERGVRPPKAPKNLAEIRSAVARALDQRGLTPADARQSATLAALLDRFEVAAGAEDAEAMASARDAIVAELAGFRIDGSLVKAKLDRISQLLQRASNRMPPEALDALEDRYLDLRSTFREDLSERDLIALSRRADALERDIARGG
jgi:serine/threonine-protein kinase